MNYSSRGKLALAVVIARGAARGVARGVPSLALAVVQVPEQPLLAVLAFLHLGPDHHRHCRRLGCHSLAGERLQSLHPTAAVARRRKEKTEMKAEEGGGGALFANRNTQGGGEIEFSQRSLEVRQLAFRGGVQGGEEGANQRFSEKHPRRCRKGGCGDRWVQASSRVCR